jgi:hypothetical protein
MPDAPGPMLQTCCSGSAQSPPQKLTVSGVRHSCRLPALRAAVHEEAAVDRGPRLEGRIPKDAVDAALRGSWRPRSPHVRAALQRRRSPLAFMRQTSAPVGLGVERRLGLRGIRCAVGAGQRPSRSGDRAAFSIGQSHQGCSMLPTLRNVLWSCRQTLKPHPAGGDDADGDAAALQPRVPRQQLRRAVQHCLRHAAGQKG